MIEEKSNLLQHHPTQQQSQQPETLKSNTSTEYNSFQQSSSFQSNQLHDFSIHNQSSSSHNIANNNFSSSINNLQNSDPDNQQPLKNNNSSQSNNNIINFPSQQSNQTEQSESELSIQQRFFIGKYLENQILSKFEEAQRNLLLQRDHAINSIKDQQSLILEALPPSLLDMTVTDYLRHQQMIADGKAKDTFSSEFQSKEDMCNYQQYPPHPHSIITANNEYSNNYIQLSSLQQQCSNIFDGLCQAGGVGSKHKNNNNNNNNGAQLTVSTASKSNNQIKNKYKHQWNLASKRKRDDIPYYDDFNIDSENIDPNNNFRNQNYYRNNGQENNNYNTNITGKSQTAALTSKSNRKLYTIQKNNNNYYQNGGSFFNNTYQFQNSNVKTTNSNNNFLDISAKKKWKN